MTDEKKKVFWPILEIFIIGILALGFSTYASCNFWVVRDNTSDSSVFSYVARVILNGGMPYRDAFDHKGPLIYLINVVGLLISDWKGIWVIEVVTLFSTFFIMYRIARLFVSRIWSLLILLTSSCLLGTFYKGGNLTEEYAMPFIAAGIYIFIDYFVNHRISKIRLVICGASFAAVLMLRANMCALWIVMCIVVLVQCIIEKRYRDLGGFLLWFITGALLVILPIVIWLGANGVLKAFVQDYLVFNGKYTSDSKWASTGHKVDSFTYFTNRSIVLFTGIGMLYVSYRKRKIFDITYTLYLVVNMLMISMSGQSYEHYGMILIPAFVYPFVRMTGILYESRNRTLADFFMLYLICIFAAPFWLGAFDSAVQVMSARKHGNSDQMSISVKETAGIVDGNTSENDRIMVFGNWDIIYNLSDRFASNEYSYQAPVLSIDKEKAADFWNKMNENKPKVIVYPNNVGPSHREKCDAFLRDNGYVEIGRTTNQGTPGAVIYALQ